MSCQRQSCRRALRHSARWHRGFSRRAVQRRISAPSPPAALRTNFMKLPLLFSIFLAALGSHAQTPSAEDFRVLPLSRTEAPAISPYLKYQTEMAWDQDDHRRKQWESISSEEELTKLQHELQNNFFAALGGLPAKRTPLNPRITGQIPMKGFRIEKLIYES